MAMPKPSEIRNMTEEERKAKFQELEKELMYERGVAAMGGAPASPGRLRALRRSIARVLTIEREMELAEKKEEK